MLKSLTKKIIDLHLLYFVQFPYVKKNIFRMREKKILPCGSQFIHRDHHHHHQSSSHRRTKIFEFYFLFKMIEKREEVRQILGANDDRKKKYHRVATIYIQESRRVREPLNEFKDSVLFCDTYTQSSLISHSSFFSCLRHIFFSLLFPFLHFIALFSFCIAIQMSQLKSKAPCVYV